MFASKFTRRALAAAVAGGSLATILAAGATGGLASSASAATSPAPAAGIAPAAAVIGSDRLLGYTGTEGGVWLQNLSTGGLTSAGGHLIGAPALMTDGSTLFVFGRGTDNHLWVNSCNWSFSCGAWVSLGGNLTSAPAASVSGPSAADYSVYARGANGALWSRTRTASGWGGWRSLGGQLRSGTAPAAAYMTGQGPYTLVVGTNQQLYVEGPGVTGFSPAGGRTTSTPALTAIPSAQNQPAALIGFARGTDNAGYYHRFIADTPGWHSMGGRLNSGLAAFTQIVTTIPTTYAYALGADNQIYEDSGAWAAPTTSLTGWHQVG